MTGFGKTRFLWIVLLVAAAVTACGGYVFWNGERLKPDAAYEMQQTLLGGQNMDLGRVYTVRMLVNGTRVDATSLTPEVIALEGKDTQRAATIATYSPDRTHIILFTRDPETGEGFVKRMTLDELRQKPSFEFPVVVGNTVAAGKFEVLDLIILP